MKPTALPHAPHPIVGEVAVPGSKSETNRALVLAALADGPSHLTGALESRDSSLMIQALRALGTSIETQGTRLRVAPPVRFTGAASIDCGLAGTVMRFVPAVAMLADGATGFVGDPHASQRPMGPLLDGLRQLGALVTGDRLPFRVSPPAMYADAVAIDSSVSSQFVSALLLIGARLPQGLTLTHTGAQLPSRPHIDMTVAMLRDRGVGVTEPDERTWVVAPGSIASADATIEPDLTNASVFLAAAAITGGSVSIPGWPRTSIQPGAVFLGVAEQMGARIEHQGDSLRLIGPESLRAVDVDLATASELTPVVAALGAFADGVTTISGVAHIRGHETDRLAALETELRRVGVDASQTADGLRIVGGGALHAAQMLAYADHRMVHVAALLALRVPGIEIDDIACVSKTMPRFPEDWARLVG